MSPEPTDRDPFGLPVPHPLWISICILGVFATGLLVWIVGGISMLVTVVEWIGRR